MQRTARLVTKFPTLIGFLMFLAHLFLAVYLHFAGNFVQGEFSVINWLDGLAFLLLAPCYAVLYLAALMLGELSVPLIYVSVILNSALYASLGILGAFRLRKLEV